MKRRLVILLLLLLPLGVGAQSLSVESFRMLENDLTANTYGTTEYDQNGNVAALIKVVTSENGFAFDAGMLGIVKTVQRVGEIWVYVPYGLQRITIAHQEFGVLRDYYFPVPIEKARTYELRLNAVRPTPKVTATQEQQQQAVEVIRSVTVTLNSPQRNANILVDGNVLGTGSLKIKLTALTEYKVEVRLSGYHTYTTTIRLEPDEDGKTITLPELEPIAGTLRINSKPAGATVYVGGFVVGVTPVTKEKVPLGMKLVEIKKKDYYKYSTTVKVSEDKIYDIDAVLREIKYLGKDNFYIGGGYQKGNLTGASAYMGFYLKGFNMEGGYTMPFVTPERVCWVTSPESWKGSSSQFYYDYSPSHIIHGNIGFGLRVGKRLRFTPQVGVMYHMIEGAYFSNGQSTSTVKVSGHDVKTWVLSGKGTLRIELCPFNHLAFAISPSYAMPYKMGNHAAVLNESSDLINNWCGGLSVKAGLEIFF